MRTNRNLLTTYYIARELDHFAERLGIRPRGRASIPIRAEDLAKSLDHFDVTLGPLLIRMAGEPVVRLPLAGNAALTRTPSGDGSVAAVSYAGIENDELLVSLDWVAIDKPKPIA